MTNLASVALSVLTVLLLASSLADAQCPVSVLTTGLNAPSKIIFTTSGNLLVAEQGNGVNTGRISIVDKDSGIRRTLIAGLPSAFAPPNTIRQVRLP